MATTALWRVTAHALGDLADYVMNPEKTAVAGKSSEEDSLENVMHYAARSDKVEDICGEKRMFVSGVNCVPDIAVEQMNSVKEHFDKTGGVVAYHGYQSFKGWETTPEIAHEIGVRLADKLWGDRYQVLVTTHLDRESHLHNHFVVNTVSFVDGVKYHRTKSDYWQMRELSDELCCEYGLSVIERPKPKQKKLSKRERDAMSAIDEAIARASSLTEFSSILRGMGYSVNLDKNHKHWTIISAGWERAMRMDRRLGENYTNERIAERIASERYDEPDSDPPKSRRHVRVRVRGDYKKRRGKAVGLSALYYHYCYLLKIFPKKMPSRACRYRYVLKDDLDRLNMISDETKLLTMRHIGTDEQLFSYRDSVTAKIRRLTDAHLRLYNKTRTVAVKNDESEKERLKAEMANIGEQIAQYRREVKLCDDIAKRSGVVRKKVRTIRSNELDSIDRMSNEERTPERDADNK